VKEGAKVLSFGECECSVWILSPEMCRTLTFNFIMLLLEYQLPIQWVPGALSLGVKRLGLEVDHSPPSSAEVKE
jgi:hypothetical protein